MDNLNDHDPITVIEFCAGYGGLGLGIKGVLGERMRLIGLCELEGFAQANLISKMEAGLMAQVPIWSNLLTFPYRKFRGLVDIAAAGIPCQPHSLAGKRSGGGDERFLFDDWLCGLEQMQPRAIFIENVEGFLSSKMPDGTLCVEWTIKRLEAMGYKSATGIFSAREVGAPHQRKRVFILAKREGEHGWRLPIGEEEEHSKLRGSGSSTAWPSRPGQPQHAFEPPRVVANTLYEQSQRRRDTGELGSPTSVEQGKAQQWKWCRNSVSNQGEAGTMANSSSQGCDWRPVQDRTGEWSVSKLPQPYRGKSSGIRNEFEGCGASDRGGKADRQTQSTMGGDFDGTASGMDYAELSISCDNRTDELRLIGNGVVPATANLAFRTLLAELLHTQGIL